MAQFGQTQMSSKQPSYLDVLKQKEEVKFNLFDFSSVKQSIQTKQMNFGAPMSGKNITNFTDFKANIPTQTQTTQKSGFSLIPTVNAMEQEDLLQQYLKDPKQDNNSKQQLFQALQDGESPESMINFLQTSGYKGTQTTQEQPGFLSKLGSAYIKPIQILGEELVKKPADRLIDWALGRDLDPTNTYNKSDIWKTTGAGISAGFNTLMPGITGAFNVAGSTETGEKVLSSLPGQVGVGATLGGAVGGKKGAIAGGFLGTIPGATDFMLNNVPGLNEYYNSLDEEGKAGMQNTVANVVTLGVGAGVSKMMGKKPTEVAKQLDKLPENVAHGIVDAVKTMPENIKKSIEKNKQTKYNQGVEEIYQAVNPTTRENKAQLRQKVDDLLPYIDEKNMFNNDLDKVKGRVDTDKNSAYVNMKNYEDTIGVKGNAETAPIIKKIEDKFIEKTSEGIIIDEATAKVANELIAKLKEFGPVLKDGDIIKVRKSWDKIIEKNKGFMQSAESNTKGDVYNEANKFFREEIRKSNPEYANYLKQYHKTVGLSDILEATIQRRTGQSQGGYLRRTGENIARVVGTGLGASIGGVPGAVVGSLATEGLIGGVSKLTGSSAKLAKGKKLILKNKQNDTSNNNISNNVSTNMVANKEQLTSGPRLIKPSILSDREKALLKPNQPTNVSNKLKPKKTTLDKNFETRRKEIEERIDNEYLTFLDRQKEGNKGFTKIGDTNRMKEIMEMKKKREVEILKKEFEKESKGINFTQYPDSLLKEFNNVNGILQRSKKQKTLDKFTKIEELQKTNPSFKKLYDEIQGYIYKNDLDKTVQEVFDDLVDLGKGNKIINNKKDGIIKKILPSNFKEKAQDFVEKVAEKTGAKTNLLPTNSKQVSKVSDDLISEAKKYKSADEFIKDKIEFERGGEIRVSNGEAGKGIYLFPKGSKGFKEYYVSDKDPLIYSSLKKGSKIEDLTKRQQDIKDYLNYYFNEKSSQMGKGYIKPKITNDNWWTFGDGIESYIKERGLNIDGYIVPHKGYGLPTGKQVIIKNEKVLNTISDKELKQIYEQSKPKILKPKLIKAK